MLQNLLRLWHAIHSATGAFASWSGWQTVSTRLGPPCASASFSAPANSPGSVTRRLFHAEGGGDLGVIGGFESISKYGCL
jgi:hypothetical protein